MRQSDSKPMLKQMISRSKSKSKSNSNPFNLSNPSSKRVKLKSIVDHNSEKSIDLNPKLTGSFGQEGSTVKVHNFKDTHATAKKYLNV